MTTTEALCYGLARRYDPFMVNNVTGFIGPETHRDDIEMIVANLQDHFMGKLLGLPMGMAPCYTLHSEIAVEGQQVATQLLTAAGANYFMDVYLTIDRMLAYFDTSGHDDETLRELHGRTPAPEYLEWAIGRGLYERGEDGTVRAGRSGATRGSSAGPTPSCAGCASACRRPTASRAPGRGRRTAVARAMRANQAVAREAIHAELDEAAARRRALPPHRLRGRLQGGAPRRPGDRRAAGPGGARRARARGRRRPGRGLRRPQRRGRAPRGARPAAGPARRPGGRATSRSATRSSSPTAASRSPSRSPRRSAPRSSSC